MPRRLCLYLLVADSFRTSRLDGDPNRHSESTFKTQYQYPELFSSGERSFFNETNKPKREGVQAFNEGNYSDAVTLFDQAVESDPHDPEVQTHFNNARALKAGDPFIVAAVVPVGYDLNLAKEILRGVADGQTEFNKTELDGRLLEIVIANDNGNSATAKRVAKELTSKHIILGVIGHSYSKVTQEALSIFM